jgi:uncharacterized protein
MPEYLSPGVYIEEFEIGAKPIEGVATSTAAFLGQAERGTLQPRLVTSWLEYVRWFGEFTMPPGVDDALPLAVRAFFDNGGQRVYVTRIVKAPVDRGGAQLAFAPELIGGVQYYAKGAGSWGNRIRLQFTRASSEPEGSDQPQKRFRARIFYWSADVSEQQADDAIHGDTLAIRLAQPQPAAVEEYDDLDLDPNSPNFVEKRLTNASALVTVYVRGSLSIPEAATTLIQLENGSDGAETVGANDYDGQRAEQEPHDASWGLTALNEAPYEDVALVHAPRAFGVAQLVPKLITHCENNRFRFLVLDSQPNEIDSGTLNPRTAHDTKYAAFYYPWYWGLHPRSGVLIKIPPGGAVTGIYARSDNERGVWKAPANEVVRGASELEFDVTKGQQDALNPRGVNVIRQFPGRGIRVWGARTLSSDPLWKYINVRRLFIFLEASIYRGTQWIVFEPNNEQLWARVRQTISQFLRTQWRAGALMGLKEDEAFFVKADRTTMTQDDIDNGRLIVLIGIAPVKPAEFVIFRFAQFTAAANANG